VDRSADPNCSGGTSPRRVGAGAAEGFRSPVQPVIGLAAAHLQSPGLIMHPWTTSFPWCPNV
jgi:hypothetical protein